MKCPTELKIRSITKHGPLILKSYRQNEDQYPLATAVMKVLGEKSDVLWLMSIFQLDYAVGNLMSSNFRPPLYHDYFFSLSCKLEKRVEKTWVIIGCIGFKAMQQKSTVLLTYNSNITNTCTWCCNPKLKCELIKPRNANTFRQVGILQLNYLEHV